MNPHNEGFLLPKFRRDDAKNQNSSATVGLSHYYSRQKLATLLSGFLLPKFEDGVCQTTRPFGI